MATISFDFSATLTCPSTRALSRRKGRHHVDRGFGAFLPIGAAAASAYRDHLDCGPGQRCHPADEALLEFHGIEGRKMSPS
jgi:hypothetical protein